jgi:short-subunit dehydrogenase
MNLENKVFVVTGGASGIGRELVIELLTNGSNVAAVDINEQSLKEIYNDFIQFRDHLSIHCVDITSLEDVTKLSHTLQDTYSTIDGIINNAGIIHPFKSVDELTILQIKRIIDVNFYGTLNLTKTFMPTLMNNSESIIINVSSMGAFVPVSGQTIYGASKAAIKLLTEGLIAELSNTNIRVMVVFPGGVGSNIMDNSGVTMSQKMIALRKVIKLTTPKTAAKRIIQGIRRNRKSLFIGIDSKFFYTMSRISPRFASFIMNKMMRVILND